MEIRFEHLAEPSLLFGSYFQHEDTKTGLAEFGPFGKNIDGLHVSEIRLGFIGTRETISGAKEWIERCSGFVESENIKTIIERAAVQKEGSQLLPFADEPQLESATIRRLEKILNRDFDGFNNDTEFKCSFQMNPRWDRSINSREISTVLDGTQDKERRIVDIVNLLQINHDFFP